MSGTRGIAALVAVASLSAMCAPPSAGARSKARTWYVKAGASARGHGSRRAPFNSLAAVQRASRPRDTIIVLPSPRATPPLDGGIALKLGQHLRGAGRPVTGTGLTRLPRIANTRRERHSGDAVELAHGATVRNLVIGPSARGGIYGLNTTGVRVFGNDVSGQNTSCTTGFVVLPFILPTTAPGVGVPINGLPNGWAGIMVDADRRSGNVAIAKNVVHDADCGDGIDIRLNGSARVRAGISRNRVTRLKQGKQFMSLLAIGMQTQGTSRLSASIDHNSETEIGSSGADSEGVFANLADRSHLRANITHNSWHNGIGGFSVNGMEMVITSGSPVASMRIADSSFSDSPGDLLEEINFGTNARMSLDLSHVIATRSNGPGNTEAIPGNNGDCLVMGHTGAGDTTSLRMRSTQLTNCVNNGLTVASGVSNGSKGPARSLRFDIDHSRITGNRGDNIRVVTETELTDLQGKVQNTNLSGAGQYAVALEQLSGTTQHSTLDFGGGPLGSAGRNCIFGARAADIEALGFRASARSNWWGRPGGPAPGRVIALNGSVDTSHALASSPQATC